MNIKIYHNPRCSKSRQALSLITEGGNEPEIVEYLKTPPTREELAEVMTMIGDDYMSMVRVKEEAFRPYKGKELTKSEVLELLTDNPKLIERPIVIVQKKAAVCRPPEKVNDLL